MYWPYSHKKSHRALKTYFKKQGPNMIMYRDYKKFSKQIIREEFVIELSEKKCPGRPVWLISKYCIKQCKQ